MKSLGGKKKGNEARYGEKSSFPVPTPLNIPSRAGSFSVRLHVLKLSRCLFVLLVNSTLEWQRAVKLDYLFSTPLALGPA